MGDIYCHFLESDVRAFDFQMISIVRVLHYMKQLNYRKTTDSSVNSVVEEQLCCACGACAGICPKEAILMERNAAGFLKASIDPKKCVECGLCVKVCPSVVGNAETLHKDVYTSVCGHAVDESVWRDGQSGGIGTAILLKMLSAGVVDGAVVTKLVEGIPQSIYTEDASIIKSAAGSVYAQSSVVKAVLKNQKKRIAVVCLGCQARAIRKATEIIPGLSERIFIIGLICGGNMSLMMKEDLLNQMKANDGIFRYRDKKNTGWPGNPSCETADGLKTLDKAERMKLKSLYEPYRCIVCPDKMNINADILLGDPWGLEEYEIPEGMTVAISYTKKGDKILQLCEEDAIIASDIEADRVRKGQNEAGIEKRLQEVNLIAKKNKYSLPFESQVSIEQPYNRVLSEQIAFARKLYVSKSRDDAWQLVKKRKRATEKTLKEVLYTLKKKVFK